MARRGFKIADGYLEITADRSQADREMRGLWRDQNGYLRDAKGKFAKGGDEAGEAFSKGVRDRLERNGGGFNLFGLARRAFPAGLLIGRTLAMGIAAAVASGLANTAIQVGSHFLVQFAAAAAHAGGALALLAPAGILTLVTTLLTLKLAFSGLGTALKAGWQGDAEKFAQTTKTMGKATNGFLADIISLKPALQDLKKSVQEGFFTNLLDTIKPLATIYLPMVKTNLTFIANAFGAAAKELSAWFDTPATFKLIGGLLANIAQSADGLAYALTQIIPAFLTVASVGSGFLPGLAAGFTELAQHFNAFISAAAEDGSLKQWISDGLSMLGSFLGTLKDVGGIFHAIFSAAPEGSTGLLGIVGSVLHLLNQFLNSAAGQGAIQGIFTALSTLTGVANTLLQRAGPGLVAFIQGLGVGLEALLPAAGPVGDALGAIFLALTPILPLLGNLATVVLVALADILRVVAVEVGPFIMFFSQLAQEILPMLLPLFGEFVNGALPALVEFFDMLFAQSSSVLPLFVELAKVLVESLLPVIPLLISQTEPLRDSFVELVQALVPLIAMYLPGLINYLPVLIKYFIFAVQYTKPFIEILALVIRVIAKVIDILHAIIGKIAEFMAAVRGISSGIQSIFSGSEGWLTNAGDRIISGLINGIKNAANTKLQSTLRWVTSLIPDWKGPEEKDRKLLQPAGRAVMGGFMMGIERSLPDLRNLLGGVTGELPRSINPNPSAGGGRSGAPTNLGPYVVQVGDKTMAQFVIDAITGQPKVVADALSEGNRRRGYLNTGRAS